MEIKSGKVDIKWGFFVKEFDEDEGIKYIYVPFGTYMYRILDFNGWKPQQIFLRGRWLDLAGMCKEINELL